MRPTIKDVAKHAGVSVATVSRYLNHSPLIAQESVEKVKASMEELHYQPNFIAKSFANQKSRNIAFVVDSSNTETTGDDYFLHIQYGAEQKLGQDGYFLMIISIDGTKDGEKLIEKIVLEKRVDGIIIPAALAGEGMVQMLKEQNVPFVVFGKSDRSDICWIDLDNTMGGRLAAHRLLESGKGEIGFVTNSFEKVFAQERFQGFVLEMNAAGKNYSDENIVEGCNGYEEGYDLLKDRDNLCAGYVVTDNVAAFGMLKALAERRIDVPEDVQIISFDDSLPARLSTPAMTVVDIDVMELGRQAAALLLSQLGTEGLVQHCLMPVTLIERGTTKG